MTPSVVTLVAGFYDSYLGRLPGLRGAPALGSEKCNTDKQIVVAILATASEDTGDIP